MKSALLLLLVLLALPIAAAQRPNFIVVFIDDMGRADLSCFGNTEAKTPNIDRLAAEGIRFGQFYVNSPICSPSRCALTTGQYPQRWKITSFLNNRADNRRRGMAQWLDPQSPVLARFLKESGYATGHFGKWHLGGQRDVDNAPPISRYGFDESLTNFEGMGPKLLPLTLKPGDTEPGRIWEDAERLGGPVTWMQRSEITSGFVAAAIPFIDRAAAEKKPFYINLWPDDVHSPFWPPVDKWAQGKRGMYLAVLQEMDRQLGRLFDHIRDTPALRDNTLILLCSDNGHEPGAGSAGLFRGAKGTLYEGGVRSPLIVWGPGRIDPAKAGSANETSVFAAFDLPPSLLEIAGARPPEGTAFDGEDLSATLLGKSDASRQAPIFWRRPPDRKMGIGPQPVPQPDLAVREGNWKLLCEYDGSQPALYDLAADPGETKNLAVEHPEVASRLAAAAVAWHRSLPADRGPELGANALKKEEAPRKETAGRSAEGAPNILILLADDLGFADVGFNGGKVIATPHLDRLAATGVRLTDFRTAPMCSPTRAGLLTGRWPLRFGMMRAVVPPWSTYGLPQEENTLPELLAAAGYEPRAIVGKWHLGHARRRHLPLEHGFTHFYGHYNGAIDYFTHQREGERDWHRGGETVREEGYATDLLAAEAVRFIRSAPAGRPWFLYVPFNAPHSPFQAKPVDLEKYASLPMPRRAYAAMVGSMDQAIGEILAAVESRPDAGNTLTLFFSDNGGVASVGDNRPYRDAKLTVYEGGTRVAAAVRWPDGGLAGGRTFDGRIGYIDILPTALAAARAEAPENLDGIDVLPALRGTDKLPGRPWFTYLHQNADAHASVHLGNWKLVAHGDFFTEKPATSPKLELYDLAADPAEKRDLAVEHPETVAQLHERLREFGTWQKPGVGPYRQGRRNFKAPKDWVITD